MADKFEIKKVLIPLSFKSEKTQAGLIAYGYNDIVPINNSQSEAAWNTASKLGDDGWELVSTVPLIGSSVSLNPNDSQNYSWTVGYILIFQRKIT